MANASETLVEVPGGCDRAAGTQAGAPLIQIENLAVRLGGKHSDGDGYDLIGLMTGSEGLLGVVTEVTVRILPTPPTARALLVGFPSYEAAGDCVAKVIGAGIIPGGMEMMDKPAIHAAEDFVHAGYPLDVEALLIVELDGPAQEVEHLIGAVKEIPISGQVAAISCGLWNGAAVLDLDYAEDSTAQADANFVLTESGAIVEVQGTAEGEPFSRDAFGELLDLAAKGTAELCDAQRTALGL